MSWFRNTLQAAAQVGHAPWDDYWYKPTGQGTLSGMKISPDGALSSSPMWAGVNLKSGVLASLPMLIYRQRPDGGKDRAPYHQLYPLLHDSPNPLMTSFTFKKVMEVWRILWGNCHAEIRLGSRGFVESLWPLHPDGVREEKIPGGMRYQVRQPDGSEKPYNRESIFHLPGLTLNGTSGLSLIQYARESIALNLGARNYSSSFLSQGGRPSGVLEHPGKLTPAGRKHMREEWEEIHAGAANAHKVAILQEGVKWSATGMTAEDAQLLGLLEWSVADIARFLNIPLHMLQETSKVTSWGSGIEEIVNGYVTFSLMPDLILWQQAVTKDLMQEGQGGFFAEFVVDALLRGKTLERYQAYQIAGGAAPWMTPNEIRSRENQNPLPGGDEIAKPALPPAPGPRPPAAPPSNQPKPPNGLAETLARDTAARIVRRETEALTRLARRGAESYEHWAAAVREVYAEHAVFVADALHIDPAICNIYIRKQVDTLLSQGPEAATSWEPERIEYLTMLALEAQE